MLYHLARFLPITGIDHFTCRHFGKSVLRYDVENFVNAVGHRNGDILSRLVAATIDKKIKKTRSKGRS